jgi:hypothetical protein
VAKSRARREDHPALPGARPGDEHRLAARFGQRLADRAAADKVSSGTPGAALLDPAGSRSDIDGHPLVHIRVF